MTHSQRNDRRHTMNAELIVSTTTAATMYVQWLSIFACVIQCANSLIGYDCAGEGLNITTLSLIDVGTCNIDEIEPVQEDVFVQLMQTSDYDSITVTQCKVEVDRTIYYCGMHSHVSVVQNGRKQYEVEIGQASCARLHETGTITLGGAVIDRILQNQTNYRSVTLAGKASVDGKCSGTAYSDNFGEWDNVLVQAAVRIKLRMFDASIKRSTGILILPSGTHCRTSAYNCIDSEGGETFWPIIVQDSCHFERYDVLYEGFATRLSPSAVMNQTGPTVYTVTTQDTTFALARTTETNICGYKLYRTEHPKLFIMETKQNGGFRTKKKISVDNLDIFTYVNSKFIYVEKHVKTQLSRLYRDIMEQKCALERQILRNALSLASIAPDEMASQIMKTPGYTAVAAGEVIHLIKCVPVQCKIRHSELCYNELPITYNNASVFLLPRSRIITRSGTIRECNELLPTMYKLHDRWFKVNQRPSESLPPPIIQPLTQPTWSYVSPEHLATSGIYTSEDLDRLKNHIMFPVEKPAILNVLARGAMGQAIPAGTVSITSLLDEASLDKIAQNTSKRIWHGFLDFGSASAGILAIIIIVRLAKLVIDTIIHGYALHSIYGWSLHLLGALWASVTSLLLHLGKHPPKSDDRKKDKPVQANDGKQSAPEEEPISQSNINATTASLKPDYAALHEYIYKDNIELRNKTP